MPDKKRIAILGGGTGALTSAFYLTNAPDWSERFDITVYALGWRLGGKGASGRNAQLHNRIEEHGLHIWYGFYENAFGTIRKCYQECAQRGLLEGSPLGTWRDAFHKQNQVTVMEPRDSGWSRWNIDFPPNPWEPGDGVDLFGFWDLLVAALRKLVDLYESVLPDATDAPGAAGIDGAPDLVRSGMGLVSTLFRSLLHRALDFAQRYTDTDCLIWLLERFLHRFFEAVENRAGETIERLTMALDVGVTALLGMLREDVLIIGFAPLDRYDLSDWLRRHGCRNYWSPLVRSLYTGLFAFQGGDADSPNLAAGVALRGALRMFCAYKGAIAWRMQAGMGDTIFAPLYLLLRDRGVKFEFFQRVENLRLSEDKRYVDAVDITVQAKVASPAGYIPVNPVNGVPSWPAEPFWDQLEGGGELRAGGANFESFWEAKAADTVTLSRGRDFDLVLLGIPVGAHRFLCRELVDASPDFERMVTQSLTVPTQAFQIWMKKSAAELGWQASENALMTSYLEPYDTWGDMSHLIPRETWPEGEVQNISYFCGTLRDQPLPSAAAGPEFTTSQEAVASENALMYLQGPIQGILPGTAGAGGTFDWNLLAADREGDQRLREQYSRANVDPGERYVQSGKDTIQYRLAPDASGFENLYLAGDWTSSGMNAGCIEGAVMSGMHAARSITGMQIPIAGESDHPPRAGTETARAQAQERFAGSDHISCTSSGG